MKRLASALTGIVTAALLAAPVVARAQDGPDPVSGFKLPPAPSNTPDVQGPVVDGVAAPRAPRPAPTVAPPAAPATRAEASTPAASPKPAPKATASPMPAAPPTTPSPSRPAASATPSTAASSPAAEPQPSASSAPAEAVSAPTPIAAEAAPNPPAAAPAELAAQASPPEGAGGWIDWWHWILAGLVAVCIAVGVAWLWRERHETGGRLLAPPIEPPKPRPRPAAATAPEASPAPAGGPDPMEEEAPELPARTTSPLRCALEATRLSLTLLNALLSYRLTLHNLSNNIIRDISIGSDLVTAHASLPINQQIADAEQVLQQKHGIALLLPGQNVQLSGELRLPIPAIQPLRRGDAVMFVPLLRLRIDAEGLDQIVLQTVVIGQKPAGPGAGLRPFRLDLGPRIYGEIGHRLLSPQG